MREKFAVRLATIDDADVIAAHRARMFHDMGEVPDDLLDMFRTQSRDRLREFFERGEYVGWLASSVDAPRQVIAGAGVQLRHTLPHPSDMGGLAEGRHALIINVFTEPPWRRRGLGELLLKRIIAWSREQKLDRLLLHSSEQGRRLYERLGFVQTNEMKLIGAISEQPEQ
ncbi:MAG: hypothetical protein QOH39_85 [Verrucomicrobiota bacterium]